MVAACYWDTCSIQHHGIVTQPDTSTGGVGGAEVGSFGRTGKQPVGAGGEGASCEHLESAAPPRSRQTNAAIATHVEAIRTPDPWLQSGSLDHELRHNVVLTRCSGHRCRDLYLKDQAVVVRNSQRNSQRRFI